MKKLLNQVKKGHQDNVFSEAQSENTEELCVLQNKII